MNRDLIVRHGLAVSAAALFVVSGTASGAPREISFSGVFKGEPAHEAIHAGSARDLTLSPTDAERADAARGARHAASSGRGLLGPVLMRDNLEAYMPGSLGGQGITAPPSFLDPPGFPWGLNNLRGQSSQNFVSLVDLSGSPLGGSNGVVNASQALRVRTAMSQGVGGFFTGASLRWDPILYPGVDQPAVGSAEHFVSTIDDQYTFETANIFSGFISARMIWGGPCDPLIAGDCGDPKNPVVDPLSEFYFLGVDPDDFTTGAFMPSAYCLDAMGAPIPGCVPPSGQSVGDPALVPVQDWFRLSWSFTSDGLMTAILDRQDGSGAQVIAQSPILTSPTVNRVGWNAGFVVQDASMHIDNIEASGYVFEPPIPPAFECPFLDDLEWLIPGPLLGQAEQWFAPLASALLVIHDGAQGNVIQATNNFSVDYAEAARRTLPSTIAFTSNPWTLCVDAKTSGDAVRAFAPDSELSNFIPGGVTTRVYLGREDTSDPQSPFFDPTVYVQINPDFDPLGGDEPVVGVDIVSTGYQWTDGAYRQVCISVDADASMTLSIDGSTIYTGNAFTNGVSQLRVEMSNADEGPIDSLRIDNVSLLCEEPPVVELPPLTLPYCDDFEWAMVGLPPNRQIDDPMNQPQASTRYSNANGVTIESVDLAPNGVSQVVAMRNVFRDTAQNTPPDINSSQAFIFTQFTSDLPSIQVDHDTGWRVTMDLAMNDFLTSRGFSPAQAADFGSAFELVGYLWYHAPNDRFYLFASSDGASPDDDLVNIDTGFTRAGLGIAPNAIFEAGAEYIPATGKIRWSINGTVVGETNPIVGEDVQGFPRLHRNLDAIFVWGGDDDTAPSTPPLSTLYLDNLCVIRTGVIPCQGDTNGDALVNFTDLNAVLAQFGQSGAGLSGDVNTDGTVNFLDLNIVLSRFGASCD